MIKTILKLVTCWILVIICSKLMFKEIETISIIHWILAIAIWPLIICSGLVVLKHE